MIERGIRFFKKIHKLLLHSPAWELLASEVSPMATPSYSLSLLPSRTGLLAVSSLAFRASLSLSTKLKLGDYAAGWSVWNSSWVISLVSFPTRHHQLLVHGSHTSLWCCQHWLGSRSCGDWLLAWAGPAASEVRSDGHPVVEEPPVSGIFNSSSTLSWDSDSVGQIFTSFPGDADADSPVTTFWETLSKRAHEAKKKRCVNVF